jgi:uncharacterized OB-fold protein
VKERVAMTEYPRLFSPYDKPMWDSVAAGTMRLQCCGGCGAFRYPPGPACPRCLSTEYRWEPIAGHGRVLSWTTFHRQYLPAYPAPNTVVAVQLTEGPIMVTNVAKDQVARLSIDAPVRLVFADHPDGYRIPRFEVP